MSELKVLPEGWKWVKLGEIASKLSLNKIKIKQKDYLVEGNYPVVDQGQDLIGGYYDNETLLVPNEPPYVVFGDHTKIKKFINFQFIPGADGLKVLKAKTNVEAKFLYYALHVIKIENKGYARHFQLVEKELFPLPSVPTQQAIVSKIEELFSELDNGIENLKTAQAQLKVYRQSVLKWAFEGKLTNGLNPDSFDLSDENDLAMVAEPQEDYGNKANQSNHSNQKNHSADKEGLPVGWNLVRLGEVASISSLKHTPSVVEDKFYVGLEHIEKETGRLLPHVGIESIKTVKNIFRSGEILYGKLRPYLNKVYLAKEDGVCSTDILVFKISNNCNHKYLLQLMLSKPFVNDMSNNTSGVNLPRVSTKYIQNYEIPLPPIEEQIRIVQEIEARFSVADKMEETIQQSLLQAESLRQSILKKAFEGELVK